MERPMQERKEVITVPTALRRMAFLVATCLLASCSKVTAENYAKVKSARVRQFSRSMVIFRNRIAEKTTG